VQLVNGGKETVDALLDHPGVRAISFVGSTPVAKYIYSRATANGKRAQCQGGAKNPVVIIPDADMDMTTRIMADSAFGCAGQRCLAASVAVTVGDARRTFTEMIADVAASRVVGYGLDQGVQMGPVISRESKARIETLIGKGVQEGATALVDGRNRSVKGYEDGFFVYPTVLDNVDPAGATARTEIFGPVLSLMHASSVEQAVELVNNRAYGNMACIFTNSGATARYFTMPTPAMSASTLVSPLLWPTSRSVGGTTASLVTCMRRRTTASSSTRKPKWSLNGGQKHGVDSFSTGVTG
jgi:malonate-semialdehyde dehydrogenase (acetylating)/methylmalonate-semialdehyde dehydrogenase